MVNGMAIRSKDPKTACIIDEDQSFALGLLRGILADREAVQRFGVQDVAEAVRRDPEILMQVGLERLGINLIQVG